MASAIVLCAGFGTRLRPLTDELPKPLAPVGDHSILEHTLTRLSRAEFTDLVVNVHHLAELFTRPLSDRAVPVQRIVEAEIRGTAGGVAGARAVLRSAPVLVWNGDILVDPPLDQLLVGCAPESFCLGVAPREPGAGSIGLDEHGHVVRLRGCLFGDVALPMLRAGATVRSVPVTAPWIDAGDLQSLLAANLAWLSARGLDGFVAEGAELGSGVRVRDSLVGRGARVLGEGALTRCVVCPGATVNAPLNDAIVAPSGRVIAAHA